MVLWGKGIASKEHNMYKGSGAGKCTEAQPEPPCAWSGIGEGTERWEDRSRKALPKSDQKRVICDRCQGTKAKTGFTREYKVVDSLEIGRFYIFWVNRSAGSSREVLGIGLQLGWPSEMTAAMATGCSCSGKPQ